MLIVLSPSKTLDFSSPRSFPFHTLPAFLSYSQALITQLRTLTPAEIMRLMKVSPAIASLTHARYQDFRLPFTPENARPALLAFRGDVYTDITADSYTLEEFQYAQHALCILSGLYGILRPLDLIQPYRLEMGTALPHPRGKNLYSFWQHILSEHLHTLLHRAPSPILINLASQEYFSALIPAALGARIITPVFKEYKNGQYRIIGLLAKRARGAMAQFAITHRITDPEQLKAFDGRGYQFTPSASSPDLWVFCRKSPIAL